MSTRYRKYVLVVKLTLLVLFSLTITTAAETNFPVAVRFWGQAMVSIETYWNLKIVIDPYALRIGYDDPGMGADLILLTHEHSDHANVKLIQGNPHIIRGLDTDKHVKKIDMVLDRPVNTSKPIITDTKKVKKKSEHAVHIYSIAAFHDEVKGKKRGENAMLVMEVNGVRILHCGDLGQPELTEIQLQQIGKIDVLLIPVGGVYTVDGKQAVAITERIRPRIVVPIHYKMPKLKIGLNTADLFLEKLPKTFERIISPGNTLAISKGKANNTEKPRVVVLKTRPWHMPSALAELFQRKDKAARSSQSLFTTLSINQLNHRPSNGTHTPRWNVEHMMGRELGFFSVIYSNIDPMIPHIDLNPRQMPPDYVPAHPDWTGDEEARQIERVIAFTRRFSYVLDGIELDDKLKGSRWTLRRLLIQMERHYGEHTENVKKKFILSDWPTK